MQFHPRDVFEMTVEGENGKVVFDGQGGNGNI
jgi:hypothetical protein